MLSTRRINVSISSLCRCCVFEQLPLILLSSYSFNHLCLCLCLGITGLNSGAFMGYVKDVRKLLEATRSIPSDLLPVLPGGDQGIYQHLLLSGRHPIALDHESSVFQAFGFSGVPEERGLQQGMTSDRILYRSNISSSSSTSAVPLWINAYTHKSPAVIHFNADGKTVMEEIGASHTTTPSSRHCNSFHKLYF